jgi:predicted metal-dependent hydrolase
MRIVDVGGQLVEVHVRESARARRISAVHRPGEPLELVVPPATSERAVDVALRAHRRWLARRLESEPSPVLDLAGVTLTEAEGKELARERVGKSAAQFAVQLGVSYRSIAIRDTRSLWGSCSPAGTLSFSWRLILAPADVLEYVVAHELCHLRIGGHPPSFWRLVENVRPSYRLEREWLRNHGWELLAYRPARA